MCNTPDENDFPYIKINESRSAKFSFNISWIKLKTHFEKLLLVAFAKPSVSASLRLAVGHRVVFS